MIQTSLRLRYAVSKEKKERCASRMYDTNTALFTLPLYNTNDKICIRHIHTHSRNIFPYSLSQNTTSLFIKVFGDLASISIYQVELEDSLNQSQVS